MPKLTLSNLANLTGNEQAAIATINNNSDLIETALENTLSRDGTTPNTMEADLDLNGYDLLNVGTAFVDGIDILAGASDSELGYVDFIEVTPPNSPQADTARVYAYEASGTRLAYKNSAGTIHLLPTVASGGVTDNALSRFDATTGHLVQNSGILLDDSNNLTTASGAISVNGTPFSSSVQSTGLNGIDGDQLFIFKQYTTALGGADHPTAEIATMRVQRSTTYTGGTPGNVESNLWVRGTAGAGVANFEWNLLSQLTNNATGGQNVAIYAQVTKNATGPSWGNVSEVIETTGANPTTGSVGIEVDMTANGTDTSGNRLGIDVVAQNYNAGVAPTIGHGIRIGPESGNAANGQYSNGITLYKTFATGINLSDADCSIADIVTKGAVLVGGLSAVPTTSGGTVTSVLSVAGIGSITGAQYSADATPTIFTLAKSRNASKGGHTIVQSGDTIGDIRFEGSDGTNFIRAAVIRTVVDGTPGTNDMPGTLQIFTTPDGSATPVERLRVTTTGAILASAPLGGIGYRTGAGGTVTQATSKATGVTLNTACGQITMNNASLAAVTNVTFTFTNSAIAANDQLVFNHISGGTLGAYNVNSVCSAGSAAVTVRNLTAGALGEALVLGFVLIKAVTA